MLPATEMDERDEVGNHVMYSPLTAQAERMHSGWSLSALLAWAEDLISHASPKTTTPIEILDDGASSRIELNAY